VNLYLAFRMDTLAQRYLTIWNYVADAGIFLLAKPIMDSFSAADRTLIIESAREAAREQIANSRKGLGANGDRSSLDELARRNVTVTQLSDEEKEAFARVTKPVYDKWAATIGADLVRRAEAAIRAARA
jgi:TRAP-type C4-dicarboxylate transport system substrate-binding protein